MDNENIGIFYSVTEYIKENFIGLLMLIFAFLIIYVVDYINRLNSLIFSSPISIPIPGYTNSIPISGSKIMSSKIISKGKKHKK